ncbi:MAG: murein L,D-transpeptidase catalytic domain family protein [Chitinophagaceae bacterium]|nr:MAG: murein L,D-transpeptidase catalytic domain family protein [Chitinophagaceae bacterium]
MLFLGAVTVLSLLSAMTPRVPNPAPPVAAAVSVKVVDSFSSLAYANLYESLKLDSLELSREAFTYAVEGYNNLLNQGAIFKQDVLSIVDFSLPSSKKRLFIIDLATGKLLFNTFVSHGRNSGMEQATRFSNDLNSFQSSLGFFITGNTYKGEHGYSLRLQGLEKGINDNALNRGIVIHAANYVNEKLAMQRGYIGRSLGCPAVPVKLHRPIIQKIKDGSCLFLYGPDTNYAAKSSMINRFGA